MSSIIHKPGTSVKPHRHPLHEYFSQSDNIKTVNGLAFTGRENCAILPPGMPRWTVSQRLRATLKKWFAAEGRGTAANIARFSHKRPGGSKITTQNITYFFRETAGRINPITLDDLDDIADFFNVSIGELFGLKPEDLSGEEQRLLWAFRALPEPLRAHFLAVVDHASVSVQSSEKIRHIRRKKQTIKDNVAYGGPIPPDLAADLAAVALQLHEITQRFTALIEPTPQAQIASSARRGVVD